MWRLFYLASLLLACRAQRPVFEALNSVSDVSVVVTMICRNEAVNFRSNLRLWFPVVDYFTFIMDSRNSDDSEQVIDSILKEGNKQYIIEKHEFVGFGKARTTSLDAAWRHFPKASHVIIADPDWRPRADTLDKAQLIAANSEVFRFTVYDRNKITTRRIDWMLRHRQGLKMRYHLHEVLDIGYYSWTDTAWEIDEIEQEGTWHNEEGHVTSFAAKRYKFDLDMLKKDQDMYQNDSHVDYYLGVTHNSYAEKLLESRKAGNAIDDQEVQHHYDKAVHHLKRRATGVYKEEFTEQRWGCMLTLAYTYEQPEWHRYNRQEAIKWYKLCRDYSPKQFECTSQLIQLYISSGLSLNAVEDAWELARTEPESRIMLNTRGGFTCALPDTLAPVFAAHLSMMTNQPGGPAAGLSVYAKYILALANQLFTGGDCPAAQKAALRGNLAAQGNIESIHQALAADNAADSVRFLEGDPLNVDLAALCQDPALRGYLVSNEIHVHPCGHVMPSKKCTDFDSTFPGVAEAKQMAAFGEFVGAASVIDVIHQVHTGNGVRSMPSGHVFNVLFAQHFNARMVARLIGFCQKYMPGRFRVTVAHSDTAVLEAIIATIAECGHDQDVTVDFIHAPSLEGWLQTYADTLWGDVDAGREPSGGGFFDYIEYNGGVSTSARSSQELTLMRDLLQPDGVVGATYFTTNKIQSSLFDLVDSQNPDANPAFSREAARIIRGYLQHQGLAAHAADAELVKFFSRKGGSEDPRRVYSGEGIGLLAASHGYSVAATLPTLPAHPYSEAPEFYEVVKYRELGASEDTFLYHFGSALRHTVYLTPQGDHDRPRGRATVEAVLALAGEDFQVIDRTGSLANTFRTDVVQSALDKQYPVVYGTSNPPPLPLNLSYVVPYSVLPALPTVGSAPTFRALVDTCEDYWNKAREKGAPAPAPADKLRALVTGDLGRFLGFMERIDLLSFVHNDPVELRGHRKGDPRPSKTAPSTTTATDATESSQRPSQSSLLKENLKGLLSSTEAVEALAAAVAGDTEALKGISEVLTEGDGGSASASASQPPPPEEKPQENASPIPRSPDIRRPKQTLAALHASHRRPECSTDNKWRDADCKMDVRSAELGLPVRATAVPGVVNQRKTHFDHLQMRYIAKKKPQLEEYILSDGLPGIEAASMLVEGAMKDQGVTDPATCLFLSDVAMDAMSGAFNRIFFVSREPMLGNNIPFLQDAAAELLPQAITRMKAGAAVSSVDGILTEPALAALSSALLLSTIYFDLTNGQAFVSHDDDGLAFNVFNKVGKELARALPGTVVKKSFVMAMDLRLDGKSPIMMAGEGEAMVVLWLSPTSLGLNAAKERQGESKTDALVYFPRSVSAALRNSEYKIDFHADMHTEFLTAAPTERSGPFQHAYPHDAHSPELVMRNVNRAAIVSPGHPFHLMTEAQGGKGSFDQDAVLALVVTLGLEG